MNQEKVFHEKLSSMRSKSEIDHSNLRKIICDREKTLTLQNDEIQKLKESSAKKLTEKDHKIAILKSQVSEMEVELHRKNCLYNNNDDYKQKYEDLLVQVCKLKF